jgi:hypothetical protein
MKSEKRCSRGVEQWSKICMAMVISEGFKMKINIFSPSNIPTRETCAVP